MFYYTNKIENEWSTFYVGFICIHCVLFCNVSVFIKGSDLVWDKRSEQRQEIIKEIILIKDDNNNKNIINKVIYV